MEQLPTLAETSISTVKKQTEIVNSMPGGGGAPGGGGPQGGGPGGGHP